MSVSDIRLKYSQNVRDAVIYTRCGNFTKYFALTTFNDQSNKYTYTFQMQKVNKYGGSKSKHHRKINKYIKYHSDSVSTEYTVNVLHQKKFTITTCALWYRRDWLEIVLANFIQYCFPEITF